MSQDFPGSHQAVVHSTSAEGFNARALRNALGAFATGVTIITTRSRDGNLGRFKPGLGMIVAGADVPVVPCYLHGAFAACPADRTLPHHPDRIGRGLIGRNSRQFLATD